METKKRKSDSKKESPQKRTKVDKSLSEIQKLKKFIADAGEEEKAHKPIDTKNKEGQELMEISLDDKSAKSQYWIFYRWSSLGRAKYIHSKWQFLSNMSPFSITVDGLTYPTVEHYFHAMKWIHGRSTPLSKDLSKDPVIKTILETKDPVKLKQLMGKNGKLGKLVPDIQKWKKVEHTYVEKAVRLKVQQHPGIKRLLLESGDACIAERKLSHRKSTPPEPRDCAGMIVQWKDKWYGNNSSGKIWMKIRDEIQKENENKKSTKEEEL